MTTVQKIKQLAREQGRSISYLCKQLGFTSRTYFNDIEKNHREIPLDKLEVIARTLGVTVDYLLDKEKSSAEPVTEHAEDNLWSKICRLTIENRNKVDGYVTALLDDRYREEIAKTKNA